MALHEKWCVSWNTFAPSTGIGMHMTRVGLGDFFGPSFVSDRPNYMGKKAPIINKNMPLFFKKFIPSNVVKLKCKLKININKKIDN
jgi:hypothetical protein